MSSGDLKKSFFNYRQIHADHKNTHDEQVSLNFSIMFLSIKIKSCNLKEICCRPHLLSLLGK